MTGMSAQGERPRARPASFAFAKGRDQSAGGREQRARPRGEKRTLPGVVALTLAAYAALAPGNALAWVERHHNAVDWLTEKQQLLPLGTPTTVLTYDANGNRVAEGTRQYAWDIRDTLTAVTDGAATLGRYDYDAAGQRIKADTLI